MRPGLLLISLAALAGCKAAQPSEQAKAPPPGMAAASAPTMAASASASASASAGAALAVSEETPLYQFAYSYPAAAGRLPALKAWLDADLAKQKADLIAGAKDGRDEAKKNGFDYNPYAYSTEWKVVTDLPGWLSLSAQRWSFTGGAHGNPWADGLVWDKTANMRREALDLFTAKQALSAAIRAPFCAALDKQRAEKRGEPVRHGSTEMFDECIDPAESTVILGSSDKQHFTRIGVLVNPYEAGPYVEGFYEVTLPVTPAVLKAVRPEYRAAFAAVR
ncbi:MAG: DUF3298 and DUF4163 domain-containing protein [Sphingomonadales bacterium]|nr:DUF3298 and DUF4163 domain-containing protein [Sphingomonadales bacterium]